MSDRIQVRAIRRAGELLRQIDSKAGGDRQSKHCVGDHTMITRTQAATDAGIDKKLSSHAVSFLLGQQILHPNPPTL